MTEGGKIFMMKVTIQFMAQRPRGIEILNNIIAEPADGDYIKIRYV
jgi:hypothetical protein